MFILGGVFKYLYIVYFEINLMFFFFFVVLFVLDVNFLGIIVVFFFGFLINVVINNML